MTRRILYFFIKQAIFWLVFFALCRAVFLLFNLNELQEIGFTSIFSTFFYALYLDISAVSYLLIIPFLLLSIMALIRLRFLSYVLQGYYLVFILIISVVTISDLELYKEWGVKLNYKALSYLSNPSEVVNTAKNEVILLSVFLILLQTIAGFWFYKRYIHLHTNEGEKNYLLASAFILIAPALLFLGIRGGWQPIPISQSNAYFSSHQILNVAAVNSFWNLGYSIEQNRSYMDSNPYQYNDIKHAREVVKNLHKVPKDTTISVLSSKKPNIVFILLESWSADLIASLGGYEETAPEFAKLEKEGLLFTNYYTSGNRSDQGIAAVFSGFPAQPATSIIKQPDKFSRLPCISKSLKKAGYNTSFYFGGQLSYSNLKGYLYFNEFDKIIRGADLPRNMPRGKLGVHDEFLFDYHLKEMEKPEEPFFTTVFTLSSHSPYDQPMEDVFDWGGKENDYINSAYYTDKALGEYMQKVKQMPWYDNTLFVIMADHSHKSPKDHPIFSPEYASIPMLWYGKPLKEAFRGKKADKICSQIDVPATLLAQLELPHEAFVWSKNIFNPYAPEFAYYGYLDGMGWIKKDGFFVYHTVQDQIYHENHISDQHKKVLLNEGKSYLQVLFQNYLDY